MFTNDIIHRLHSDVQHVTLSNKSLTKLPSRLSQFDSLTSLDISGNYFTSIQEILNQCPKLTTLNISNNHLTLFDIENNNTLTAIDVSENKIKDEDITTVLQFNTTLTNINMDFTLVRNPYYILTLLRKNKGISS